ncbi:MAG TPA: hypothetical protein VHN79_14470 [Lacunisphaera sp.]|nr:hypothetical protein [Lacunisphaera sp.]HEX2898772.1 hypothetical protein [Bacteroidia bacterium]
MSTLSNVPLVSPTDTAIPNHRWEGHMSNGVGATYGSTPMAFLSATSSELVLTGPLGAFHLPRASVVKLGRGRMYPWFFAGLRIHHRDPKFPEELQFKPLGVQRREIFAQLRALGFSVA